MFFIPYSGTPRQLQRGGGCLSLLGRPACGWPCGPSLRPSLPTSRGPSALTSQLTAPLFCSHVLLHPWLPLGPALLLAACPGWAWVGHWCLPAGAHGCPGHCPDSDEQSSVDAPDREGGTTEGGFSWDGGLYLAPSPLLHGSLTAKIALVCTPCPRAGLLGPGHTPTCRGSCNPVSPMGSALREPGWRRQERAGAL